MLVDVYDLIHMPRSANPEHHTVLDDIDEPQVAATPPRSRRKRPPAQQPSFRCGMCGKVSCGRQFYHYLEDFRDGFHRTTNANSPVICADCARDPQLHGQLFCHWWNRTILCRRSFLRLAINRKPTPLFYVRPHNEQSS